MGRKEGGSDCYFTSLSYATQHFALKISMAKERLELPSISLHHVVKGKELAKSPGLLGITANLTDFGIPLGIVHYLFPDSPAEAMVYEMALARGKPTSNANTEESVRIEASSNERVLIAYGQRIFILDEDLQKGLVGNIPETEMLLRISRRPEKIGDTFYPSYGVVWILENLGRA